MLCTPWRMFLGAFAMICIIVSALLFIANYFVNSGKPKASKKPLLWLASAALFALAVLSIVIYVITPPIITTLRGPDYVSAGPCDPYYLPAENPHPYCGENCTYNNTSKTYENCTC